MAISLQTYIEKIKSSNNAEDIEIMQNYGAYNAANLDGGTSTAMAVNYELINDPVDSTGAHKTRFVSTGFGLIE